MTVTAIRSCNGLDIDIVTARAKAIAFDLDGTLARSKKPISQDMADCLTALTHRLPLAVITGGQFSLVHSQILDMLDDRACKANMHLMPTSGTRYYHWDGDTWACVYEHNLSAAERDEAISSLQRHAKEQGIWESHVWGERIEDRGSQITFSALGQSAPLEAKEAWDPTNEKKNRLAQAVSADVPDLAVRSGGSTSVDISLRGVDKAYAVRHFADALGIQVSQVVYVGDRMDPDGNDYPAVKAGTMAIRVSGPEETLLVCDELIRRLPVTA
ncbi:HAD-IIB family hydrolase [Bifidobacterium thermophilum]|uniref:HAD-IIB family hydrolase n=1 Tax=Bifidobacterium thermophilum TaxID=33905 RepID=UPI00309CB0FA